MLTLHGWNTPNSLKVLIMLFELDVPFQCKAVPLDGSQFSPEFTKINANQKTPVLSYNFYEGEGHLSESGAILHFLAEKYDR